jgi:two-component system, chemotaxis family, response regulator Rcp1
MHLLNYRHTRGVHHAGDGADGMVGWGAVTSPVRLRGDPLFDVPPPEWIAAFLTKAGAMTVFPWRRRRVCRTHGDNEAASEASRMDETRADGWIERLLERRDAGGRTGLRASVLQLPVELEEVLREPGRCEVTRSVLLVEDNPGDIRLVREALASGSVPTQLTIAQDGLEALTLLQRAGRNPDLILLDLNLPALDGRSLLRRIKTDPRLLRIPVIVLTTSDAPQDVWSAYDLHANSYLVKPADFAGFERALHHLVDFWAATALLPNG